MVKRKQEPLPVIRMFPVESSNIEKIGYLHKIKVVIIQFKGGAQYKYLNFTKKDWAKLCCCESVGKFFAKNIKDKFECHKIPFSG